MTIIYRLEDYGGTGVYRAYGFDKIKFDAARHPSPSDDSLLMENLGEECFNLHNYHFGFVSLEQLRFWFYRDECLKIMHEHDVVLSIYEAKEVYVGNTQLVFNRETAQLVSRNNLLEFFGLNV